MDDFACIAMLRHGSLRDEDVAIASAICNVLRAGGQSAVVRRLDQTLLVGASGRNAALEAGERCQAGRLGIVFSGRIDNRAQLEADLSTDGAGGGAVGCAELVLRAFAAWGERSVARLEGAFAFVIYDAQRKRVFAARDRFGVHHVHFLALRDRVLFSSRLAILAAWHHPGRHEIDGDVVSAYLAFGHAPVGRSPLKSFGKLRPAHSLTVEGSGAITHEPYWQLASGSGEGRPLPASAPATELRKRLDGIVACQADGQGRVSVLTDNSLAARALVLSARRNGIVVRSPSVLFAPSKKHATRRSHRPSQSRTIGLSAEADSGTAVAALSTIGQFSEPYGHIEAIRFQALTAQSGMAGVNLSTGGGAELLLAHARYGVFTEMLARPRSAAAPASKSQGFHQTVPFVRDLYSELIGYFSDADRLAMAGPALAHTLLHSPADDLGTSLEHARREDAGELGARIDLKYGAPRFLAIREFAAANRFEAPRFPFLHCDFVDFCSALPRRVDGNPGQLLAAVKADADPEDPPTSREANQSPIDAWLRNDLSELMQDTFASVAFRSRDLFNQPWLDRLVRDHVSGKRANGPRLWLLLCLDSWLTGFEAGCRSMATRNLGPIAQDEVVA